GRPYFRVHFGNHGVNLERGRERKTMKAYFSDLPRPLQDELGRISTSGVSPTGKFYKTEGTGGKMFAVVCGFLFLGVMIWISVSSHQWELPGAFAAAGAASLFFMMIVFNFVRYKRYKKSKSRPGIIASPILL